MAYEINERTEADYRWFRFEAPSELLDSLDHNLKIADGVLRFRIFKVDPERAGDRRPGRRRRPRCRASAARGEPATIAATPSTTPTSSAARRPALCGNCPTREGRGRAAPALRLEFNQATSEGVSSLAASNVNVVVITGNLTQDPELRHTGGGTSVCELRVAVNSRRKDGQTATGSTSPTSSTSSSGAPGRELRQLPLQGPPGGDRRPPRLARVGGQRRQRQTAGGPDRRQHGPVPRLARRLRRRQRRTAAASPRSSDVPADTSDFEGAAAGGGGGSEDDIPF